MDRRIQGAELRYRGADGVPRTKRGFPASVTPRPSPSMSSCPPSRGRSSRTVKLPVRLDEMTAAWLESIESRREPKTVEGYECFLAVHVLSAFGNRRAGSITFGRRGPVRPLNRGLGRQPRTVGNAFYD